MSASFGEAPWGDAPLPPQGVIQIMSLRDYFAAAAMQGLISGLLASNSKLDKQAPVSVAISAYSFADFMLAERNK